MLPRFTIPPLAQREVNPVGLGLEPLPPESLVIVREPPVLFDRAGLSAGGESEEGVDGGFERAGVALDLCE